MSLALFRELAALDAGNPAALYKWNADHTALYGKRDVKRDDLPAVRGPSAVGTIRHVYRTTVAGTDDVLVADVVNAAAAAKFPVSVLVAESAAALVASEVAALTQQHEGTVKTNGSFVPLNAKVGALIVVFPSSPRDLRGEDGETAGVATGKGAVPTSTLYRGFNGLVDLPAAMPVLVGTLAKATNGNDTTVTINALVVGGHVQAKPVKFVVPVYARMKMQLATGGEATQGLIGDILTHALRNGTNPVAPAVAIGANGIKVGGEASLAAWHKNLPIKMFSGTEGAAYAKAVASPFLQGYASGKKDYTASVLDDAIKSLETSTRATVTLASLKALKGALFGDGAAPAPPPEPLPAPVPTGASKTKEIAALRARIAELEQQLRQRPSTSGGSGGGGGGRATRVTLTDAAKKVLALQAEIRDTANEIRALRGAGGAANAAKIAELTAHGQALYKEMDRLQVV